MNKILILHAPDIYDDALMLCHELDLLDFVAETYTSKTSHQSRTVAQVCRAELFDGAPAIIMLGSAQLFYDEFYLETALFSLPTKVVIFVLYDQGELYYPVWFRDPIVLKNPGTSSERAWNRLIQRLMVLTGPF